MIDFSRPVNRVEPAGPAQAYKSYTVAAPRDTLIRAVCEEVGCPNFRHGWRSTIDENTDLGRARADYIRHRAGRTFREMWTGDGLTIFVFEAGQRCFTDHRTRPETYTVQLGDWRGRFGPAFTHARPGDWVDDFGEHQLKIAEQQKRG